MDYSIRPACDGDAEAVAAIFNHFIQDSFAAYPSVPADKTAYHRLKALAGRLPMYAIETSSGAVVGFGLLRPLHFADTMTRSAEVTIFILPDHTRHGVGSRLLQRMEHDAVALGVDTLIGGASSHNPASLLFQQKHGFLRCGEFKRVGRKFDQDFDIVWMQKFL